jgi:anthranilate phosphoribosyltransferase
MDEISPIENTQVMEFTKKNPEGEKLQIIPENLGLNAGKIEDLFGGIKEINAAIMRNVLQGRSNPAQKNAAIINAAAGLVVFGKAKDMQSAVKKVEELVKSGKAFEKLEEFIEISNSV